MATADVDAIEKCEKGFEKLQTAECKSLLKKYLTRDTLDQLKVRTTDFGSTLYDVIQSGVQNLDSHVGIYAPDVQAYKVFEVLFDPVIEDYHHGFRSEDKHPASYWGNPEDFGTLDDEDKYIISTRIRIGRSIDQFPLNPKMTEQHYHEIEKLVKDILSELDGELEGNFHSLSNMSQEVKQQLIDDHFLFKEGDRFLEAANANRFWPTGRGIFHNHAKTFLVWCNEEDHLRIISMENGSNVKSVYSRLVNAVQLIQQKISFSNDERLGYLTFCPTNLGTTLRASVLIKIPNLLNNKDILKEATDRYKLQVRGFRGENSSTEDGIADVSNKRRIGLTEYEAVKEMYEGVKEIISLEKCLSDST